MLKKCIQNKTGWQKWKMGIFSHSSLESEISVELTLELKDRDLYVSQILVSVESQYLLK